MANQTRDQAFEFIKKNLEDLGYEYETVTEETPVSQVLDSLDVLDFSIALEKNLPKEITDKSIENWETFKDVVDTYLIISSNE